MANEQNLKPFKKGNDPRRNLNGRPKGVPDTKTRLMRYLDIVQEIKNPVSGELEQFTVFEQMDLALIAKARKGDVRAYNALIERLEGKAKQAIDMTSNGETLNVLAVEFVNGNKKDTDKDS